MGLWLFIAGLGVLTAVVLGWRARVRSTGAAAHCDPAQHERRAVGEGANFVGIAEIARFPAMRRRIGFHAATRIMEALAERVASDPKFELGRVGRTTVEFLYHADDLEAARAMMRVLKRRLEQPVAFGTIAFEPEVLIGSNPVCTTRLRDELFDAAASAVEDAAKLPEKIFLAGDLSVLDEADRFADMLSDLKAAIRGDMLELHYMPKVRIRDDAVVCAEALCRWTHPEHGVVSPVTFIRLAEDAGLIGDLTLWAINRAIADQALLAARHKIALDIDVNMSAQLIGNTEFCDQVIERIATAAGRIGFEITETAAIQDSATAFANLERIRAAGIHIAIDDFGSGLSSFAYLRDLPADELKIDQMFVRALTTSNRDPLLVRSAIDIAHALEMEVTAEGVEDEIALALLKVMRCDNVQGYLISPPLAFEPLVHYLRDRADEAATPTSRDLRAAG